MKKLIIAALLSALLLCLFSGCAENNSKNISTTVISLDTVVTITIYDKNTEKDWYLIDRCIELLNEYEKIFSRTMEASELYALNQKLEAEGRAPVNGELAELILLSIEYSELTGGVFDPTIGAISRLWDFTGENENLYNLTGEASSRIPNESDINANLQYIDYRRLKITDGILEAPKGTVLDLGASAKGYIADKLREYLVSEGVSSAVINLGGDVMCLGKRTDSSDFRIGVKKPFGTAEEICAILSIDDCSVVTSGTYERFFYSDGKLFHHILDPETGHPANTDIQSVTIISRSSSLGDALGTACLVLGSERSLELIDSMSGVFAMFILNDGSIIYSESFERLSKIELI